MEHVLFVMRSDAEDERLRRDIGIGGYFMKISKMERILSERLEQ